MGVVKKIKLVMVLAVALLGACAEVPKKVAKVEAPSLETLMTQVASASEAGQAEEALSLLRNATSAYPTDKTPWLQMAQLHFDRSSYGEAINNALEVLQRDPADKVANSIVAVGGLRLSTKALADLSQQNNLSGTVRTEAQDLAQLLRESLGEAVLVPVPVRAKSNGSAPKTMTSSNRTSASGPLRPALRKKATVAVKPTPADNTKPDLNPFGSLK